MSNEEREFWIEKLVEEYRQELAELSDEELQGHVKTLKNYIKSLE